MLDLVAIRKELRANGWVVALGTPAELKAAAELQGLRAATEKGREKTVLKPYEADRAPPKSISAHVGLGPQPLHTDGAHLETPPDIVALYSAKPTSTPTIVWAPGMGQSRPWLPEFASQGIFIVHGNRSAFLASAHEQNRTRFDPFCMSPGDQFARETVAFFEEARPDAFVHEWTRDNELLILDNRRVLHARNEVVDRQTRRIERMTFGVEERE